MRIEVDVRPHIRTYLKSRLNMNITELARFARSLIIVVYACRTLEGMKGVLESKQGPGSGREAGGWELEIQDSSMEDMHAPNLNYAVAIIIAGNGICAFDLILPATAL